MLLLSRSSQKLSDQIREPKVSVIRHIKLFKLLLENCPATSERISVVNVFIGLPKVIVGKSYGANQPPNIFFSKTGTEYKLIKFTFILYFISFQRPGTSFYRPNFTAGVLLISFPKSRVTVIVFIYYQVVPLYKAPLCFPV